jgi:hypothetical protein
MAPKIAIVYYSMYGHIKQMVCVLVGVVLLWHTPSYLVR